MNTKQYDLLAAEYQETAQKLKERATQLKLERANTPFDKNIRLEERIAILEAEYAHLLKVASYIRTNYTTDLQVEEETECETQSA